MIRRSSRIRYCLVPALLPLAVTREHLNRDFVDSEYLCDKQSMLTPVAPDELAVPSDIDPDFVSLRDRGVVALPYRLPLLLSPEFALALISLLPNFSYSSSIIRL